MTLAMAPCPTPTTLLPGGQLQRLRDRWQHGCCRPFTAKAGGVSMVDPTRHSIGREVQTRRPWSSYYSSTSCRAQQLCIEIAVPERAQTWLAQLERGGVQLGQLLDSLDQLSTEELLVVATCIPSLPSPPSSSAQDQPASSTFEHTQQLAAVLRVLEARDDVGACINGNASLLAALCQLLHTSCAPHTEDPIAAAEACVSARLRWPGLIQAVMQQAPGVVEDLSQEEAAQVLAALAACSSGYVPSGTLLPVLQVLFPSNSDNSRLANEDAVTLGLQAVLQLAPHLVPEVQPELQACLEDALLRLATRVSTMQPATVVAACEASTACGCVPPVEWVTAVLRSAESASVAAPVQWGAAAGLMLPHVGTTPGAEALLQALLQRVVSGGVLEAAALALLHNASCVQWRADDVQRRVAQAAMQSQSVRVQAAALRCLAAHGFTDCGSLLDLLAAAAATAPATALVDAAVACAQLGDQAVGSGGAITSRLAVLPLEAYTDGSVTCEQLLALAVAYRHQLMQQPSVVSEPLAALALAALAAQPTLRLTPHPITWSAAPHATTRVAGEVAQQLAGILAAVGAWQLVHRGLWAPMQAVLALSAQAVAWQRPPTLVDKICAVQQLGPALWRGLPGDGLDSSAAGGAAFVRLASLGVWTGVDSAAASGEHEKLDLSSDGSPLLHTSGGLEVAHLVRVMRAFGTLEWRPGQLVKDMTAVMRDVLASAVGNGTLIMDTPADAGADEGASGEQLSFSQALWFAWGLAHVHQHTGSARAYVRLCIQAALGVAAQQGAAKSGNERGPRASQAIASLDKAGDEEDSPLASTWDSEAEADKSSRSQSSRGAASSHQNTVVGSLASPTQLAMLLQSAAGVELSRYMPLIVPLTRALRNAAPHGTTPFPLSMRDLCSAMWAAARLGVCDAALASWADTCATDLLQAHASDVPTQPSASVPYEVARAAAARAPLSPIAITNLAWALHKMGWKPRQPLIAALTGAAAARMQLFEPYELTAVVVALVQWTGGPGTYRGLPRSVGLGGVGLDSPPEDAHSADVMGLLHAAARELQARMDDFDTPAAAHLVWALARAGLRLEHGLLDAVACKLQASRLCSSSTSSTGNEPKHATDLVSKYVDDQLLCNFVWASSVCGHASTELLKSYCSALPAQLARKCDAHKKADNVSAAAFAMGACSHRDDAVLALLTDAAIRVDDAMTPYQLSCFLYGCAQLGYCPREWWHKGLWHHLRGAFPRMTLLELSQTLWALSQWPMEELVKGQQLQLLREAARPVLLVHVLGAQVSANSSSRDLLDAGERQVPTADSQRDGSEGAPAAAPGSEAAPEPQEPPRTKTPTLPPISPASTADLAVGLAALGIYASDLADAVASWAVLQPGGGLTRFSSKQLISLLWAFATWRHDALELFEGAAEVLVAREGELATASLQQPIVPAAAGSAASSAGSDDSNGNSSVHAASTPLASAGVGTRGLSTIECFKLLWAFGKFNRHPGAELLEVVRLACERAAAAAAGSAAGMPTSQTPSAPWHNDRAPNAEIRTDSPDGASPSQPPGPAVKASLLPMENVCTMLYSLAIMREHRSPLANLLSAQLAAADASPSGPLHTQPMYKKQARQVAACMLAAAAEGQASPLAGVLSAEARDLALDAWRMHVGKRVGRWPRGYIKDMARLLERMAPATVRPHVATPDGAAVPDVTLQLTALPGVRFALEMVGPHNAAANSGRLLGDAALKYRLLQARGYLVVPVSCREWDRMGARDQLTKMLYLQSKLEKRIAALAASGAGTPATDGSAPGDVQLAPGTQPTPPDSELAIGAAAAAALGLEGSAAAAVASAAMAAAADAAAYPLLSMSSIMSLDGGEFTPGEKASRQTVRQLPKRLPLSSAGGRASTPAADGAQDVVDRARSGSEGTSKGGGNGGGVAGNGSGTEGSGELRL